MDMKFAFKIIAASLALASAGQANAAITPQTYTGLGGPEMFMAVWDPVAQTSYIRDLGVSMNDFLPQAGDGVTTGLHPDKTTLGNVVSTTAAPVAGTVGFSNGLGATPAVALGSVLTPGYSLSFAADPLLASYMGNLSSNTNLQWMVGAVDNYTNTSGAVNAVRTLTTSNGTPALSTLTLTAFGSGSASYITENNTLMPAGNTTNGSAAVSKATNAPAYFDTSSMGTWGGNAPFSNLAAVGTSQNFWYLGSTGATTNAATVQQYTNAAWTLNTAGNLTYAVAAVPEADTWAMLLAGLGMMGFIARRRLQG